METTPNENDGLPEWVSLRQAIFCAINGWWPEDEKSFVHQEQSKLPAKSKIFHEVIKAIGEGRLKATGKWGLISIALAGNEEQPSARSQIVPYDLDKKIRKGRPFLRGLDCRVMCGDVAKHLNGSEGWIWESSFIVLWGIREFTHSDFQKSGGKFYRLRPDDSLRAEHYLHMPVIAEIEINTRDLTREMGLSDKVKTGNKPKHYLGRKANPRNAGLKPMPDSRFKPSEVKTWLLQQLSESRRWRDYPALHNEIATKVWLRNAPSLSVFKRWLSDQSFNDRLRKRISSIS